MQTPPCRWLRRGGVVLSLPQGSGPLLVMSSRPLSAPCAHPFTDRKDLSSSPEVLDAQCLRSRRDGELQLELKVSGTGSVRHAPPPRRRGNGCEELQQPIFRYEAPSGDREVLLERCQCFRHDAPAQPEPAPSTREGFVQAAAVPSCHAASHSFAPDIVSVRTFHGRPGMSARISAGTAARMDRSAAVISPRRIPRLTSSILDRLCSREHLSSQSRSCTRPRRVKC